MSEKSSPATWKDSEIRVLPGMMLVEPIRPEKQISVVSDIIELVERIPSTIKAKVILFGTVAYDPGFVVGEHVAIPPQAGTIIQMDEGMPERMVIPIKSAIGVWED